MKLMYRGRTYDQNQNQAQAVSRSPFTLFYRGVKTTVDPTAPSAQTVACPGTYNLSYRGATYQLNRQAQGTVMTGVPATVPAVSQVVAPAALPLGELAKVHKTNLLNNLQRRLQAAQDRRDQALVAQLEAEWQQINTAYSN